MQHVISTTYSTFYDAAANVQFTPVLRRDTSCYIGHAELSTDTAETYRARPGFAVMSESEFLGLTTEPAHSVNRVDNTAAPARPAKTKGTLLPPMPPR